MVFLSNRGISLGLRERDHRSKMTARMGGGEFVQGPQHTEGTGRQDKTRHQTHTTHHTHATHGGPRQDKTSNTHNTPHTLNARSHKAALKAGEVRVWREQHHWRETEGGGYG